MLLNKSIEYKLLSDTYDTSIFTEPCLKGRPESNALPLQKHLYDYLIYDSETESKFAVSLDKNDTVTVFENCPAVFILLHRLENTVLTGRLLLRKARLKHIYFVAETKGSMNSLELRKIKETKITCARRHFAKIGSELVVYVKIDGYETLLVLREVKKCL